MCQEGPEPYEDDLQTLSDNEAFEDMTADREDEAAHQEQIDGVDLNEMMDSDDDIDIFVDDE